MTNDRKQRAERAEKMRKEREKADKRQRNLITVGIVAIVVVLIGIATVAINTASDENAQADELTVPQGATDDYGLEYTPADAGGENAGGEEDADPVRVVLYEDLQCPACQVFEQVNGEFLTEQVEQGSILLEFRYVNMLDNASLNEYSSRAANAVVCAWENGGPGAMKQVHDALYLAQPAEGTEGPEDDELIEQLESAGVDGAESCVNRGVFVPWISDGLDAAFDVEEFEGTPTVFVDGEVVRGAQDGLPQVSDLQTAIDEARSR